MPERFLDVSHEALIRGWPRLRRWLDEDRAGLRVHRRITETAEEWRRSNREDDLLYRGARLIQAQEWSERHEAELNPLERDFLKASIALKHRLEEQEREQQQRELQAAQRLAEAERVHKAESERVKLLLEKRKRERIFGVTMFLLGIIILIAVGTFAFFLNAQAQERKKTGQKFREKAKAVLVDWTNPIKDVSALQNLSLALSFNRQDTEAARLACNLLLQRVWCPPAAPEVHYWRDTLLAAAFAPGRSNNEVFAAAGDGQLLFWNGHELSPVRSLFEKPKSTGREIVQAGFASFSPDGQWLFIIPPTLSSDANAEAAAQTQHEPCKLQIWRWSLQKGTYESAGEDLEFQRLRGSGVINFAWSPESDRVVLINTRLNESECVFFEVKGNTFQELLEQSNKLNSMKIAALAFAARRSGIVAVSVDAAAPAVRKVSLIDADDLEIMHDAIHGQDSIRLSEGFQPDGVAFGPGNDQLTLTSWSGIRILNPFDGSVTPLPPPTFRDQFMRIVVGPGDFATRLVAKSLYGRVEVAKSTRMKESAEPAVFGGSVGIAQFSSDGQRLLILSGGIWNVFDRMRLIDVSPLYRTLEPAPENFEGKPVAPWLADIASAVSALDTSGDGSLLTLETVRQRYPESKAGDSYEAVWKHFFPDERTAH
jgi:hypothetical protein